MRQIGWLLATTLLVFGCDRDARKATTEGTASTVTSPSGTTTTTTESVTAPATEAPGTLPAAQPEGTAPAMAPPTAPAIGAGTGTPDQPAAQPGYAQPGMAAPVQPGALEPVPTAPAVPPAGTEPPSAAPPAGQPPGGPTQPLAPSPPAPTIDDTRDDVESDQYDRPAFGQAADTTKAKFKRSKAKADKKADQVESDAKDLRDDMKAGANKAKIEAEQTADDFDKKAAEMSGDLADDDDTVTAPADTMAPDVTTPTPAPSGIEPYGQSSTVPAPSTPGAPAVDSPPQAQDDMWKQEDRSVMTQPGRYGTQRDRPTHVRTPGGMSVLAGGGAGGFVTDAATRLTGVSGTYNLRVMWGTRTPIAVEAAYIGSAQSIDALGLDSDAILMANGVEASARYNFLRGNQWQPFVAAGAAWKHYDIRSDVNTSSVLEDDDVLEIPVQAGVAWRRSGFLVDGRVNYRQAFNEDLLGEEDLHNWGANLNLGVEF